MAWVGAAIDTTTISLCKSRRRGCSAWPLHAKAMLRNWMKSSFVPRKRSDRDSPIRDFPSTLLYRSALQKNSLGALLHIIYLGVTPLLQRGSPGMILLPPALHTAVADEGCCGPCLSTLQAIIARASRNPRHAKNMYGPRGSAEPMWLSRIFKSWIHDFRPSLAVAKLQTFDALPAQRAETIDNR
jgi:hypothetical protein